MTQVGPCPSATNHSSPTSTPQPIPAEAHGVSIRVRTTQPSLHLMLVSVLIYRLPHLHAFFLLSKSSFQVTILHTHAHARTHERVHAHKRTYKNTHAHTACTCISYLSTCLSVCLSFYFHAFMITASTVTLSTAVSANILAHTCTQPHFDVH